MSSYLPIDSLTLVAVAVLFVPLLLLWAFTEINSLRERRRWVREWQAIRDTKAGGNNSSEVAAAGGQDDNLKKVTDADSTVGDPDEVTVIMARR